MVAGWVRRNLSEYFAVSGLCGRFPSLIGLSWRQLQEDAVRLETRSNGRLPNWMRKSRMVSSLRVPLALR
jgi:hypothetical protein